MATKKDYYETLGIEKNSDEAQIKSAYRKLAMRYHPDRNPEDKVAEDKFKEASEAYEVLSDSKKRSQYDQFGHAANQQGSGFGGGGAGFGGFEDIFDFFGGGFGQSTRSKNGPRRGNDLRYNMKITFKEAFFGIKKEINYSHTESCKACKGTGAKGGTELSTCGTCKGTGQIHTIRNTMLGRQTVVQECPHCHGKGKIVKVRCGDCGGSGRMNKKKTLSINIPAGIDTGQSISMRGQGEAGFNGGPAGDLLLSITVMPHKIYTRNRFDLSLEMPITMIDATVGIDVVVPHFKENFKFSIPEGTQNGTTFKLKNKGIQHLNSTRHGDLFLKIKVIVPRKLSKKQVEYLTAFSTLSSDKQYSKIKTFKEQSKSL